MTDDLTDAITEVKTSADAVLVARVLTDAHDWAELVRRARAVEEAAGDVVRTVVQQARSHSATWQVIGDALGVTRQAAFQRYGKPVDPQTGEAVDRAPLVEAEQLAKDVVGALAAGHWLLVVNQFDPAMRESLPEHALATAWAHVTGMAGAVESVGDATVVRAGDVTVVDAPIAFEAADYTARVSFRDDRTIAGLYILPTGQTS